MTVKIGKNEYVTVAERVAMVHTSGKDFEMLSSEPLQMGERSAWRVGIRVDGKSFYGSAEVHLNAKPGSADATDPWACAETSAIGRALGFAGYGSVESIASADEIVRGHAPAPDPLETASSDQQLASIKKLAEHLQKVVEPPKTYQEAKELIATLSQEYRQRRSQPVTTNRS
jgi:hypothetical protein